MALDSRMESYHEIETDNGLATQSPGQPLSHSTFAGFTPSRISSHELNLRARNTKTVAESIIVFHIRIVRSPPPP